MKESVKSKKKNTFFEFLKKNLKFWAFIFGKNSNHHTNWSNHHLNYSNHHQDYSNHHQNCSKHLYHQQQSPPSWAAFISMKLKKIRKSSKHLLVKHQINGGGCCFCLKWLLFLQKIEVQNLIIFSKIQKRYFFLTFSRFLI